MTLRETYQAGGGVALHNIPVLITEYERALAEKDKAYRQLMGHAVGLAETVLQGHRHRLKTLRIILANASITRADKLLNSPEAQAFLKEREGA